MTDREKAIVTAYTGVTMLTGDKFSIFHKYIEDIMGRPIWTHELANPDVWNKIKEKSRDDFLRLCERSDEEWLDNFINKYNESRDFRITDIRDREQLLEELRPQGEWINHRNDYGHNIADCSLCGKAMQWHDEDEDGIPRYCWYCGADMRKGEEE